MKRRLAFALAALVAVLVLMATTDKAPGNTALTLKATPAQTLVIVVDKDALKMDNVATQVNFQPAIYKHIGKQATAIGVNRRSNANEAQWQMAQRAGFVVKNNARGTANNMAREVTTAVLSVSFGQTTA